MTAVKIVIGIVALAAIACAQEIPTGIAIPIYLDTNLNIKKVKPEQDISGTVTQDVPLPDRGRIRSGSHVRGRVLDFGRKPDGSTFIRIRFDRLDAKKLGRFAIVTSLRAVATPWEVQDAQLPKTGSMIEPNPASWTTYQIGSDRVLRGGGHVLHGHTVVGDPVPDGVLVKLAPISRPGCEHGTEGRVALWVFGSLACGPYGFDHLDVGHPGDTKPVGEIVFESDKNVSVPTGSGLLLLTIERPEDER